MCAAVRRLFCQSSTLENPSFLYAIAGVSMSMAGFAGLVAVLRRADADRAQHLFRIGTILWHCLAATFLALFPVALYAIWVDAAGVLRVSSAVLAAFALERFWRSVQSRRFYPSSGGLIAVGASIRTVDSLIALANVAVGSLGLYELALLLLLGMPAYAFGVLPPRLVSPMS
jgi:hypothetical protein